MDIIWRTSAACKVEKLEGDHCRIDNGRGLVVDLNRLSVAPATIGDKVKLSICDEKGLSTTCGNNEASIGIAFCQKTNDAWRAVAKSTEAKLVFENEIVKMTLKAYAGEGGKEVEIAFYCDETIDVGQPRIVSATTGDGLQVEWWTSAACPPLPISCSVADKNHFFDLSELRRMDGSNYEAYDLSYMKENGGNGEDTNHRKWEPLKKGD